jgi:hypothetical protein
LFSFGAASPFNLLVALCSANFLFSKSEVGGDKGLLRLFGFEEIFLFGAKLLLFVLEN